MLGDLAQISPEGCFVVAWEDQSLGGAVGVAHLEDLKAPAGALEGGHQLGIPSSQSATELEPWRSRRMVDSSCVTAAASRRQSLQICTRGHRPLAGQETRHTARAKRSNVVAS